jgi:DNA-binding response OmpR family regulator
MVTDPLSILFVGDDTALNSILERMLKDHGYGVDLATDGPTAIKRLTDGHYDVAILDNCLPRMSGLDVLKEVRAKNLPTKIIMITAVDEQELAHQGKQLGAHAILAKPFEFEKLIDSIHRVNDPE